MDTAVQVRERTQAVPNGHVQKWPRDADPAMTRVERTLRRLDNLEAWHRGLESLIH